jgi:outer membrane protein TolC
MAQRFQGTAAENLKILGSPTPDATKNLLRPPSQNTISFVAFQESQNQENNTSNNLEKSGQQPNPPIQDAGSEQDSIRGTDELMPPNVDAPQPLEFEMEQTGEDFAVLSLDAVLNSVESTFPMLLAVMLEEQVAAGKLTSAQGSFDLVLKSDIISQPISFYENNYGALKAEQPVFNTGGAVYSGYRFGRGDFEPWYKERERNQYGEFALGARIPILKDRRLDARRAELFLAQFDLQAVEPLIRFQRNEICREAAAVYWDWVAAGLSLRVQQNLIELAKNRIKTIDLQVENGSLPEIIRIDNERLLAARETKRIETERKFQAMSIKLSLFLRDEFGEPIVPELRSLPADFPELIPFELDGLNRDINLALASRPEITDIDLQMQKAGVEIASAENSMLPKLDAVVEASQDFGPPASSRDDKSPYEMRFGLAGEVPWQRRNAIGKRNSTQAKLQQLTVKKEFLQNKITAAVQDAYSAMQQAAERIEQARKNRLLALQSQDIGELRFSEGDIDLIVLNIYEQAVADAESLVIEAEVEFFQARANYLNAICVPR